MTEIAEVHEVLPASPLAPALARQLLDGWMSDMVGEATANDVRAVATEIIGNAVRHGNLGEADKIILSGTVDDLRDVVRIEIEQPTPLTGALGHSEPDRDAFGMGLRIVDGLATQWGLDEGPPGVVWFEVDR